MKAALKQFFVLTWVSLICVFIAWSYIRFKGLSEPLRTPLPHPFLREGHDIVAFPPQDPVLRAHYGNPENLDRIAKLGADLVMWIDVHPLFNGTLVASSVDAENAGDLTLVQVLERYREHRLILNFRGNRPGMMEDTIKIIDGAHASNHVLIQSPEDGLLRDLRKEKPEWLFGTSLAQVTRLIMMASVGLQSAAPLKGDVLVMASDEPGTGSWQLTDSILAEAHRRRMKVYAGPFNDAGRAAREMARGVDGVLVTDPEALLNQARR